MCLSIVDKESAYELNSNKEYTAYKVVDRFRGHIYPLYSHDWEFFNEKTWNKNKYTDTIKCDLIDSDEYTIGYHSIGFISNAIEYKRYLTKNFPRSELWEVSVRNITDTGIQFYRDSDNNELRLKTIVSQEIKFVRKIEEI